MIRGDLKRRTAMIRLDARSERPERRHFEKDHLHEVIAQRGRLIADGLSVVLGYLAAGQPAIEVFSYGGFEQWDRLVRRPLIWLGMPDPLLTAEALRESDPDLEDARLILGAWFGVVYPSGAAKTSLEILEMGSDANPDLKEALLTICGVKEKPNTRRLGNWLRAHRDRIVTVKIDDVDRQLQLQHAGQDRKGFAQWRVVDLTAESADSAESVSY
ncbi:hypothetical protein MASR1M60_30690 [Rhodocyclaceae bacterium]